MKKNIGKKGICKITGFQGIITGYVTYLTGPDQYQIKPTYSKDGVYPVSEWINTDEVNILESEKTFKIQSPDLDLNAGKQLRSKLINKGKKD